MKAGTLFCLVIVKWIELIFLILLTSFLIAGCAQLCRKLDGDAQHLKVMSIIASVLAVFNLFYNNLLTNLRYKAKNDCYSLSHIVYNVPNALFCSFLCKKPCRDRWGFTLWTPLKWLLKAAYLITLISMIKQHKKANPGQLAYDERVDDGNYQFDDLLIIYLLQHVIFIGLRPFFLFIFLTTTCCFDHGKTFDRSDPLDDTIISYNYVRYWKAYHNDHVEKEVGGTEMQRYQESQMIKEMALGEDTNRGLMLKDVNFVKNWRSGIQEGIVDLTGYEEAKYHCAICCQQFKTGQELVRLGCNVCHCFHESCFAEYCKFYEKEDADVKCPICYADHDEDHIIKSVIPEGRPSLSEVIFS